MVTGFCYDKYILTPNELQFYEARSTVVGVLQLLNAEYVQESITAWEPLPLTALSAANIESITARRAETDRLSLEMHEIAKRILMKKGHDAEQAMEILARHTRPTGASGGAVRGPRTAEQLALTAAKRKETMAANRRAKALETAQLAADIQSSSSSASQVVAAPQKRANTAADIEIRTHSQTTTKRPRVEAVIVDVSSSNSNSSSAEIVSVCAVAECTEPPCSACLICQYVVCILHIAHDNHFRQLLKNGRRQGTFHSCFSS
jgi:hypothetical protein